MRRSSIISGGAAALALAAAVAAFVFYSSARKEFDAGLRQYREISSVKDDFLALKREVKLIEGKKNLTKVKGIVDAVDQVFQPLGLKDRVQSVKPISTGQKTEEKAEVEVKGVNLNEAVNILYTIENSPMLLVTRKMNMKASFENPELLNMTLTLSLVLPE
ncbi:MAG: hypothetical protein Kow0025_13160 [Thermodesulfovibrionales bacterium]